MCGIVGFTGHPLGEDRLRRAVDSLHHRGPDGTGIFIDPDERVGFLPMEEHARTFSQGRQGFLSRLFHPQHRAQLESSHPLDSLKRRLDRKQTDGRPLARRIQYFWCKSVLAPYILSMLGDRPEMGHSIEGRTPFLDHPLFEKARQIPDRLKIHDGIEKHVLREAFRDDITDEICQRRKWPYSAPPWWIKKGRSLELDRLIEQYLSRISRPACKNVRHSV